MKNEQYSGLSGQKAVYNFDAAIQQSLSIPEIQKWFHHNKPNLSRMSSNQLLEIFSSLSDFQVYDREFVNELCDSIAPKLVELTYPELTDILHGLHEMKHSSNIWFITNLVAKLTNCGEYESQQHLVKSLWVLAKMGFHDKAFLASWVRFASPIVSKFDVYNLTQSLQGCEN